MARASGLSRKPTEAARRYCCARRILSSTIMRKPKNQGRVLGTPIPVSERLTAKEVKERGVHYTPPELARFLASHVAAHLRAISNPLRLLDPACGDGELLEALAMGLPPEVRAVSTFFGM